MAQVVECVRLNGEIIRVPWDDLHLRPAAYALILIQLIELQTRPNNEEPV